MEDRRFIIDDLTRPRITALVERRSKHFAKPKHPGKLRFFEAVTFAFQLVASSERPLNGYEIRRMINAEPSLELCNDAMCALLKRVSDEIRIERRAAYRQYLRLHPELDSASSTDGPLSRKE